MLKISLIFKKLHGQTTGEFLGSRMQNFQGIVFLMNTKIQGDFQICIGAPLRQKLSHILPRNLFKEAAVFYSRITRLKTSVLLIEL